MSKINTELKAKPHTTPAVLQFDYWYDASSGVRVRVSVDADFSTRHVEFYGIWALVKGFESEFHGQCANGSVDFMEVFESGVIRHADPILAIAGERSYPEPEELALANSVRSIALPKLMENIELMASVQIEDIE